jgi:hypothetical protein
LRSILIYSHLCLALPSCLFPSGFSNNSTRGPVEHDYFHCDCSVWTARGCKEAVVVPLAVCRDRKSYSELRGSRLKTAETRTRHNLCLLRRLMLSTHLVLTSCRLPPSSSSGLVTLRFARLKASDKRLQVLPGFLSLRTVI